MGIKAGSGIEAGWGIEAGSGIEAGYAIHCKFISASLRVFAGLVNWRLPSNGEDEIHGELREGTIALGKLVSPTANPKVSP